MSSSGRTAVEAGVRLSSVPFGWVLALDLGMALLLGAGLGFLQANAGDLAIPAPPVAVALAGAGVMGVLLSLVARLILQNWMGTLKFLLSLLSLLAWMAVSAITCAAWTGLDPFEYLARADHWVKIGQLTIGCLSILAANLVGRRVREAAPWQWVYRLRSQSPPPLTKISLKWGLGLTLAAAVVLGAGLGFLQAIAGQFSVPPLAVALGGAAVMGLLTGLMARFALRGWSEGLRIAVTLVALLIWMVEAEVTYAATVGLSPSHTWRGPITGSRWGSWRLAAWGPSSGAWAGGALISFAPALSRWARLRSGCKGRPGGRVRKPRYRRDGRSRCQSSGCPP